MRLPRLTMPEFSQRWSDIEKLPEYIRRMTDRSQRNNDEVREAVNQNEADSSSKMREYFYNRGNA